MKGTEFSLQKHEPPPIVFFLKYKNKSKGTNTMRNRQGKNVLDSIKIFLFYMQSKLLFNIF